MLSLTVNCAVVRLNLFIMHWTLHLQSYYSVFVCVMLKFSCVWLNVSNLKTQASSFPPLFPVYVWEVEV